MKNNKVCATAQGNYIIGIASLLVLVSVLSSCAFRPALSEDIITQKKVDDSKIPLTISLKYSVYLDKFEIAAEEKFPNLDLIQVGNYTSNYSDEYEQQLANDDLTDIIITWPLDKAARKCEEKLIDLSGYNFASRYHVSMLNSLSQDGKLYYLPGPTQLRGILVNKTMLEENGWEIPRNYTEFLSLCEKIEASGIRSLQLSFWNTEVLRDAFAGFGFSQSFSTPQATRALADYNAGTGSIADFATPSFESFEEFIAKGIFKPEDLEVRYPIREQMLFTRQCVMVSDGVELINKARKFGNTDEFIILPFFSKGNTGSWGHLVPSQYIGLNANLQKPKNKEKFELALQLMDYISTPEGQLALANGNFSLISSLAKGSLPDAPELFYMKEVIERGQYTVFPSYTNVADALYQSLAAMLRGELNRNMAIDRIDKENLNPTPVQKAPKIGTATQTFSLIDTGNYVTDAIRSHAGTDIALFLDNGKDGTFNARGISAKFYKGDILESDVTQRVLPVLQHGEKGYMNIATMTGENLLRALEHAVEQGNWFYYFSGLKMEYDSTNDPGTRILSITDDKGNEIQKDKLYTVAILEGSVRQEYIESLKTTDELIKDIVIKDIQEKGSITPVSDRRFQLK